MTTKNLNGHPVESCRAHLGVRIGASVASAKEVTTLTQEHGDMELSMVGILLTLPSGVVKVIPFSNVTEATLLAEAKKTT